MELVASIIDGFLVELPLACVETMVAGFTVIGVETAFTGILSGICPPIIPITCVSKIPFIVGGCTIVPFVACAWAGIKGVLGGTAGFIVGQFINVFCGK